MASYYMLASFYIIIVNKYTYIFVYNLIPSQFPILDLSVRAERNGTATF